MATFALFNRTRANAEKPEKRVGSIIPSKILYNERKVKKGILRNVDNHSVDLMLRS